MRSAGEGFFHFLAHAAVRVSGLGLQDRLAAPRVCSPDITSTGAAVAWAFELNGAGGQRSTGHILPYFEHQPSIYPS